MFGSSSGVPYWAQATASSPSKTRAARAVPSRTRRSFQGRPFSPSGLPSREWNQVHQQPPNPHPLCLSSSRAYASHVEASSALISYSLIACILRSREGSDDWTHAWAESLFQAAFESLRLSRAWVVRPVE